MDLTSTVKLNNGVEIPWVGLGVFKSAPGQETEQAVRWALEIGYRHVDTAAFYENEADVGRALKDSGVPRETVFVTRRCGTRTRGMSRR
jgi:diketogulonate reductase-like aldo/keto reductase